MPLYEYRCLDCWAHINVFFLPPRRPDPHCAACLSGRIVRLMRRLPVGPSDHEELARLPSGLPGTDGNGRRGEPRVPRPETPDPDDERAPGG